MKHNGWRTVVAAALLCGTALFSAFSVAGLADHDQTVFVAGNPDLYPIEYYDASSGQYCGLMPEIYALLEEKTGYHFVYLDQGSGNSQERLAKNGQAEIISAHVDGEIDNRYLRASQLILTMNSEDMAQAVRISFSEVAAEQLIADISQALQEISAEQKLSILSSHITGKGVNRSQAGWIYALCGIIFVLLAATIAVMAGMTKKCKANQENKMIDTRYGIGNDQYYVYCFDSLISEKSKDLYYLAYIAFDQVKFSQQYGDEESKHIQRYVSDFLSRKTGSVDYLALVGEGVFMFLYQMSNQVEADERIKAMLEEMEGYLCAFKSEYAGLFHAGVCVLADNPGCTAEAALYTAKQGYLYALESKMQYAFSSREIVEKTQRSERLQQQIMQALRDGEFQIYFQYIVDRTGAIFGAEVVSRWQHPQEGLLLPSEYIKMMNESDMLTAHDFYIFEKVCQQLEEWHHGNNAGLCLSCNFTRYSITDADFADRVKEILDRYMFRRGNLIIEVTEDLLSYNPAALHQNVQKCREFGMKIALDDIGSGYSSLSDLYHYPIDFVKVDRDIILHSDTERGNMLLQGLIRLAHSMKMKVLCEGIETEAQKQTVLDAGGDYIQGFYYSRVLPPKEAKKFLVEYHRR